MAKIQGKVIDDDEPTFEDEDTEEQPIGYQTLRTRKIDDDEAEKENKSLPVEKPLEVKGTPGK